NPDPAQPAQSVYSSIFPASNITQCPRHTTQFSSSTFPVPPHGTQRRAKNSVFGMVLFSEGMYSRTVLSARCEKSLMKIPAYSKDILISGALYAIAERDFISPLSCFTAAFYDHVWFCTNAPGRLETIKPGRADGYRCFIRGTNGDFPIRYVGSCNGAHCR